MESLRHRLHRLLPDEGRLSLLIAAWTTLFGIILSEVQTRVGWVILTVALATVLGIIWMVLRMVQAPIDRRLSDWITELKAHRLPGAISWLYDTEQLAAFERDSGATEIWLLSSDLLDDSPGGPFAEVVRQNLSKGTNYVYFVPDTAEVRARLEVVRGLHVDQPNLRTVFLPDSFFFLVPRLDIAIYNPRSYGTRSGYLGIPSPTNEGHFHAAVSVDFIDKLVGTLLTTCANQLAAGKALAAAPSAAVSSTSAPTT